MSTEREALSAAIETIAARFRSGNRVPVDNAVVPASEWSALVAALAQPVAADAEDAAKWREHVGKLDALVAFCPTCCEGKTAAADMTRDEVIFQCGRTSGKSEAARAARPTPA